MARSPRTRFAAPFVVVVAAAGGCSDGKQGGGTLTPEPDPRRPQQTWSVRRQGDRCIANQHIDCPPPGVATCNPPPPMTMGCPPEATADSFTVVSLDGKTCFLDGGKIAVTCPSYQPPPPLDAAVAVAAARQQTWNVQRGKDTCFAQDDPCSRMQIAAGAPIPPCNPPMPIKIACPPEHVIAIVETAPDRCETRSNGICDPGVKCNPPPPAATPCPHY